MVTSKNRHTLQRRANAGYRSTIHLKPSDLSHFLNSLEGYVSLGELRNDKKLGTTENPNRRHIFGSLSRTNRFTCTSRHIKKIHRSKQTPSAMNCTSTKLNNFIA